MKLRPGRRAASAPRREPAGELLAGQLLLSARSFSRLSAYVTETLGIQLPPEKHTMLQSRMQRRARALGMASLDDYCHLLLESAEGEAERPAFLDLVTTNKTDFFREATHFDYLMKVSVPAWWAAQPAGRDGRFKVWCAACSSGEEPYTVAMVLGEFAERHSGFDFSILATDVSRTMLEATRLAIFSEERIAPIPEPLRRRFLLRGTGPQEGRFRVRPELRAKVKVAPLNLMAKHYPSRETFDAIFLRNVLIYFDRPTQQAVVDRLCRHLRPEGHFFIGHSESLSGFALPLRSIVPSIFVRTSAEQPGARP